MRLVMRVFIFSFQRWYYDGETVCFHETHAILGAIAIVVLTALVLLIPALLIFILVASSKKVFCCRYCCC